jgi:hypothetical protein
MRNQTYMGLTGFLATLVFASAVVLAVQVDVDTSARVFSPGDTMVINGTITDDEGNAGSFDYRVAVVAPASGGRVLVCDSGTVNTNGSSSFEFGCAIPTIQEFVDLGIANAETRAAIPLKGGIAVKNSTTNSSEKFHAGLLLVRNDDVLESRIQHAIQQLERFIAAAENSINKCDALIERAEAAGVESVVQRCESLKEKLEADIEKALIAQNRLEGILNSTEDFDFTDVKDALVDFRQSVAKSRSEVSDFRDAASQISPDTIRRIASQRIGDIAKRDIAADIREKLRNRSQIASRADVLVRSSVADRVEIATGGRDS